MKKNLFVIFLLLAIIVVVIIAVVAWKQGWVSPKAAGTGATLALSPTSGTKTLNSTFPVAIVLNTNTQDTAGTDVIINYNPADLEVQDADSVTAGVQIQAGTLYATYPANRVDAAAGKIYFSGIINPGATSGYNGTGTLATISFKALKVTAASAVTFSFTAGATNDSNVTTRVNPTDILETVTNASFVIVPPDVTATIKLQLQGRTNHSSTATDLKIFQTGTATKVFEKADITTDASGNATITISGVSSGNYDYKIKVNGYLIKAITNTALNSPLTLDFGVLKAGDLNNDNIVNSLDFSLLIAKWGLSDILADINQDGIVNTVDFSFLNTNWFVSGN